MSYQARYCDYAVLKYFENCPFCKEQMLVTATPQEPGYRFREELICPYCGKIVRSSLEYEYKTEKAPK